MAHLIRVGHRIINFDLMYAAEPSEGGISLRCVGGTEFFEGEDAQALLAIFAFVPTTDTQLAIEHAVRAAKEPKKKRRPLAQPPREEST